MDLRKGTFSQELADAQGTSTRGTTRCGSGSGTGTVEQYRVSDLPLDKVLNDMNGRHQWNLQDFFVLLGIGVIGVLGFGDGRKGTGTTGVTCFCGDVAFASATLASVGGSVVFATKEIIQTVGHGGLGTDLAIVVVFAGGRLASTTRRESCCRPGGEALSQ